MLRVAEQRINRSSDNYFLVQKARFELESGNYLRAKELAERALEAEMVVETPVVDERFESILLAAGAVLLVFALVLAYRLYCRWSDRCTELMYGEGLDWIDERLDELHEYVEEERPEGWEKKAREIHQTRKMVEDGKYSRALRRLRRIRREIGVRFEDLPKTY